MATPKTIVCVDDDTRILKLIERTLPAPEFRVHGFTDGRDALARLHDIAPDLIIADIMMPEMDGRTFFEVVKRSAQLRDVPFVFLSAIHSEREILAALEAGADDFVSKPFSPVRLLARVRAVLRIVDRTRSDEDRRQEELSGSLGPRGALALVKFCESVRLSGRLTIQASGVERWAEFLGGELVEAGGRPEVPGEDPLDLLLGMTSGAYRVAQRALDARELQTMLSVPATAAAADAEAPSPEGPAHLPGGLVSRLEVRGDPVTIQTEADNSPDFAVTTVISRGGQIIRKIESGWPHPLQRRGDQAAAAAHVRRQHERVAAEVGELTVEAPARGATPVDGALLAWAVSFVAEQVRVLLGSVMTVALLRRTFKRALRDQACLKALRPGADGRVLVDRDGAALPPHAVRAAAAWVSAFLCEAATLVERAGRIRVRQATRMMEADLERIGFYDALDAPLRG